MSDFATSLPAYLSWQGDDALTDRLRETLMITCSGRLARTLHQLANDDRAAAEMLRDRIGRLPDEALVRVLMAPETGFRLGYRTADAIDETIRYLKDAVTAEELLSDNAVATDTPCWSALGDRYVATAAGDLYVAPLVEGIIVDFQSPWALGKLPHIAGDAEPISDTDRAAALARIEDAVRLLDAVPCRAGRTTRGFTQVIVVRSDPSQPEFYTSASSTLCLGRSVLRNPFVARATTTEVTDGLVHEAIHCVCDLTEIHDGRWLVGNGEAYHIKVASPWTERQLDIHTYLQACWVWYGLWHFWARAIESEAVDVGEGLRCLGRAFRGFADGTAIERLSPHRALVTATVREALAEGQAALADKMRSWGRDVGRALDRAELVPVGQ